MYKGKYFSRVGKNDGTFSDRVEDRVDVNEPGVNPCGPMGTYMATIPVRTVVS